MSSPRRSAIGSRAATHQCRTQNRRRGGACSRRCRRSGGTASRASARAGRTGCGERAGLGHFALRAHLGSLRGNLVVELRRLDRNQRRKVGIAVRQSNRCHHGRESEDSKEHSAGPATGPDRIGIDVELVPQFFIAAYSLSAGTGVLIPLLGEILPVRSPEPPFEAPLAGAFLLPDQTAAFVGRQRSERSDRSRATPCSVWWQPVPGRPCQCLGQRAFAQRRLAMRN